MKTTLIVIYPLLLLITPILHLWYKNYSEVSLRLIYKLLGYNALAYLVLYPVCLNICSFNYINTSLAAVCGVYIFNNASLAYTGNRLSTKIGRGVTFLLTLSVLGLALFLSGKFATILSKGLLVYSMIVSMGYLLGIYSLKSNQEGNDDNLDTEEPVIASQKKLPNIYYIIPDTYMNNYALKKYYQFDNSEFIQWLKDKGFQVNEDARPNYPITNISISSTLNMDYLENYFKYNETLDPKNNLVNHQIPHFKSKVARLLKANGYKYYHILNFWEKQMHRTCDIADFAIYKGIEGADFINLLYSKSIIRNLISKFYHKSLKKTLLNTFAEIEKIAKEHSNTPKFVMAHLICPHEPFIFDKDGNEPDGKINTINYADYKYDDYKVLYIGQLQYLNKQLKSVISTILENDDDAIILIQADHGGNSQGIKNQNQWREPDKDFIEERYHILRAIYAKNIDIQCISSVNVFRCILNSVLGTNYEMLPNKYLFSNYDNRLKTYEISEKII